MRIPRDLSGADLVRRLGRLDYTVSRQTGRHIRLISQSKGEHQITIHNPCALDPLDNGVTLMRIA